MGYLVDLECTRCGGTHECQRLWNLSACCEAPLFARYDLEKASRSVNRADLAGREATMWRYEEVLPVEQAAFRVSLGEGFTPLLKVEALGSRVGLPDLYVKDEGVNPTGSFKARGLSAAISRAAELGAAAVAIPSAGNAGGAIAAYAARAGLPAYVFMPVDVPVANRVECERLGAYVTLVNGLITDCGRMVADRKADEGWFDVSTLKEPYRVEGKKTMGYELAEQLGWELPDVVLYPTGGGTGLIGMWKAFDEMESMGWIGAARPQDGGGTGRRLCAHRQGIRGGRRFGRNMGRCGNSRVRPAGSGRRGRLSDASGDPGKQRHGRRRHRRGVVGVRRGNGLVDRNLPGPGRCGDACRAEKTRLGRVGHSCGPGGALQYRNRLEIYRGH